MFIAFGMNDHTSFCDMNVFNMNTFVNMRIKLDHFQNRVTDGGSTIFLEGNNNSCLLIGGNHRHENELVLYELDANGNFTKREH